MRMSIYFLIALIGLFLGLYVGLMGVSIPRHKKKRPEKKNSVRRIRKTRKKKRPERRSLLERADEHEYSQELVLEQDDIKAYFRKRRRTQDKKYRHAIEK